MPNNNQNHYKINNKVRKEIESEIIEEINGSLK